MMRSITTFIISFVFLLTTGVGEAQAQEKTSKEKQNPEAIGVLLYADWCSKCKELDPKLQEVKPKFKGQNILFTRFDMTNEFTKDQSSLLAGQLGLLDLYKKHEGKTGYMILLDGKTHEVLSTITSDQSPQSIQEQIQSTLN